MELGRVLRAQLEHRTHDLGDDVAGLVNHDGVTHTHVLTADLVDIVKRSSGDGRARHEDGIELGDRRQHTRAPHLNTDLAKHRTLLLRRELEGNRPARSTRRKAQCLLASERVDLDYYAVDVIVEVLAMCQRIGAELVHLMGARATAGVGVDREAAGTEPL